jgi:hypothetical protein
MAISIPPSAPSPSAPRVGNLTGLVLGVVVFVCISMIAMASYIEIELNHAQTELAAPESMIATDQDVFEKLQRSLGYGGFVGMAQSFAATRDDSVVPDMKAQLKEANDLLVRLPERTPAGVRHDLQTVLATFGAAMQKIEKATTDSTASFTPLDMAPLYAALPVLDSRVASAAAYGRMAAQNQAQFWAMLLTLVTWISLILAAALAAASYLTLRDRNSTPLRALTQSVKNMGRGDMRTPIWGMERQDTLGELARAVDMARFQFSQLPDMALLSEQGPVRIRFEGNTRSLFEAMMRVISRDSEQVHEQAASLTEAINEQQRAIAGVVTRVSAVMQAVENNAVNGDQHVRQSLQNIIASADGLKHAQEHAADQLNRIIPFMQERASGLTEITQLAGKQVAQVLQSLMQSERNLKANAEQGESAITKLCSTADNLGDRLFGAVNLLQASGKVLAQTTEETRSRLEEAIERLNLKNLSSACFTTNTGMVPADEVRTDAVMTAVEGMREEFGNVGSVLSEVIAQMTELGGRVDRQTNGVSSVAETAVDVQARLGEVAAVVGALPDKIAALMPKEENIARESLFATNIMMEIKTGFEVMAQSLDRTREQLTSMAINTQADPSHVSSQMRDQWSQMAGQIEATRAALEQVIAQQVGKIETRIAEIAPAAASEPGAFFDAQQQQIEQQTQILTELVATLGALDAHMQDIRSQVSGIRLKAS